MYHPRYRLPSHEPASAVLITLVHSILHAYPGPGKDHATVLDFINRERCGKELSGLFATCVMDILDPLKRSFCDPCAV